MDNHIEEGRLLLFKNKEKVFKNYFIEPKSVIRVYGRLVFVSSRLAASLAKS